MLRLIFCNCKFFDDFFHFYAIFVPQIYCAGSVFFLFQNSVFLPFSSVLGTKKETINNFGLFFNLIFSAYAKAPRLRSREQGYVRSTRTR